MTDRQSYAPAIVALLFVAVTCGLIWWSDDWGEPQRTGDPVTISTNNNEGGAPGSAEDSLRMTDEELRMVGLGNKRNTPVCQRMCIGANADFVEYDHSNPNVEHRCVCVVDDHFLYVYGTGDMGEGTRYQWEPVAGQ